MRATRPVVRAEEFYLPTPPLPADHWALTPPAERAVRWHEDRQQRHISLAKGALLNEERYARIDQGRWVAGCTCKSAQVVTPTDRRMWCVECGTGWWTVLFPDDVDAAEQEMGLLPVPDRNWWHPDDPDRPTPPPEPVEPPVPEPPEV